MIIEVQSTAYGFAGMVSKECLGAEPLFIGIDNTLMEIKMVYRLPGSTMSILDHRLTQIRGRGMVYNSSAYGRYLHVLVYR